MTNPLSRAFSFGLLLLTSTQFLGAAQAPVQVESLTLKQLISRLDQVDFDLLGIDNNVKEFREDFSHGLAQAAAIRVLDIGVALVRDRVQLNRHPQLIGAMQRESRTDSWQRGRQEELIKRHGTLVARHGKINRIVEGYAADIKAKFGIDLKSFFDAVERAVNEGKNVDDVVAKYRSAVAQGDASATEQITNQLESGDLSGGSSGGGAQRMRNGGGADRGGIVSVVPDPNRPGYFIVRHADGTEESVPGRRNADGTVTLDINGQSVTAPLTGGGGATGGGTGAGMDGGTGGYAGGATGGAGGAGAGAGGGQFDPNSPPSGYEAITANGQTVGWRNKQTGDEVWFLQGGNSVGQTYRGGRGTNLVKEEKVEMKDAGGGRYEPQKTGEVINWRFDIDLSEEAAGNGKKMTFRLVNRSGEGEFTVSGWRIISPNNAALANGAGEEASAVITESGNYRVEFSGATGWGSPFRITNEIGVQM